MTTREFIDCFQKLTSHGWLTWEEGLLLIAWAETTCGPIVEIGCYQGRSAMLLARLGRRLICVDPWDDHFSSDFTGDYILAKFLENMASVKATVAAVRCRVEDWTPLPAEFVYLDGDHTYAGTKAQIEKAKACGPKVIAMHDVNDSGEGSLIKKAAIELLGPWDERLGKLAVWKL